MDYSKSPRNDGFTERDALVQFQMCRNIPDSAGYQNLDGVNALTHYSQAPCRRSKPILQEGARPLFDRRVSFMTVLITVCVIVIFKLGRDFDNNSRLIQNQINKEDKYDYDTAELVEGDNPGSELKLVNVIFRHGDRSPSVLRHLGANKLNAHVNEIWPNGLGSLNMLGEYRIYKLGLELSKIYRTRLGAHSSDAVLALSSNSPRCIKSLGTLLKGFYNFEIPLDEGVEQLEAYSHCLAETREKSNHRKCLNDSGWPDEYKRVKIDTDSLPSLRSRYSAVSCSNLNETRCNLGDSLDYFDELRQVPGYNELKNSIGSTGEYFGLDLIGFFSDLSILIRYASNPQVYEVLRPHLKWIFQPVPEQWKYHSEIGHRNRGTLTLYDTYRALNLMVDDICYGRSTIGYLEIGPVLTSIVESQLTALDSTSEYKSTNPKLNYSKKRLIFYGTHDTFIELLLRQLMISKPFGGDDGNLEKHFFTSLDNANNEADALLGGFKRANFGASLVFELWETKPLESNQYKQNTDQVQNSISFAYIRLLIYQRDDGIDDDIQFEAIKLGLVCRASYRRRYGNEASMDEFYALVPSKTFNHEIDCPFKLWTNITSDRLISNDRFQKLCLH